MSERRFKILSGSPHGDEWKRLGCPKSIPWDVIAPHEKQAMSNHGQQTLDTLDRRGGLWVTELLAVLSDRGYREAVAGLTSAEVWEQLEPLLTPTPEPR